MTAAANTSSCRILLVDGDEAARHTLRLALEAAGHKVEEADDGLDGVQKALAWKPDIMLVEIGMPILDGYGVARRIRRELGKAVRLIALTGLDDRERALAAGFDDLLLKPTDTERVRSLVHTAAAS